MQLKLVVGKFFETKSGLNKFKKEKTKNLKVLFFFHVIEFPGIL